MLTELPRIQSVSEICKMMKRTARKQDEETGAWEQQPATHGIPRYPDSVVCVLTSLFEYLFKFDGDNDPAILALGQSVQTHDGSVLPGLCYHTIYCRGILCVCVCVCVGGGRRVEALVEAICIYGAIFMWKGYTCSFLWWCFIEELVNSWKKKLVNV